MTYRLIGGDQREYGPLSDEQVRQWAREGRLNGNTSARAEPDGAWQPLKAFPEFKDLFAGSAAVGSGLPPALASGATAVRGQLLDISDCLGRGWQLYTANWGLLFVSTLLVTVLEVASLAIPFIGGLVHLVVNGPLRGGLFGVCLQRVRGLPASAGDCFAGFRRGFAQLMLTSILTNILIGIGFALCVLPGVYLLVAWIFALPIAMDRRMEFWPAMELSRKSVQPQWGRVFLLVFGLGVLVLTIPAIGALLAVSFVNIASPFPSLPVWAFQIVIGLAGFAFGLLVSAPFIAPFALAALMYAYEQIIGPAEAH